METDFEMEIDSLSSAEDFLGYFQLDYDPQLIRTKRIQLMRMFHHVLNTFSEPLQHADYRKALKVAYRQLENGNELAFSASGCQGCTECDD
ncbi:nitrogenase-stabilizing/protective protein NifW [Vibrio sp. JC009]|uniref:nitrogenase-stabilizing/protective protein NifW n=1 Tax=Vibrio sp. JC009 TaxID=2912314 RepID=UPI0023AF7165|nr:nitrogenase-stabilizing/protective protein NifW [Vibrio sp. JC009]WED24083.1 nitrogenase-stabilizing/protective protein NifW [Vibrio sp. JC009]